MGTSENIAPVKLGASDVVATKPSAGAPRVAFALRLIKEPIVHFLLLGSLLFVYFHSKGGAVPGSNRIVVTNGEVEHLASGFIRTWQRPPTPTELKGLIDDYVKEEIATREALALGLDRNDAIIRRRLRQKLEFLADDVVSANPPTDAELQAWLNSHPNAFRGEPQLAFRQVYVNTSAKGSAAGQAEASRILAALRNGGPDISIDRVGDASLLPAQQPLAPQRETSRVFGDDFAQEVLKLQLGRWSGPVESTFGLHLVLLQQKVEAVAPTLDEIRPQVEREVMQERRRAQLDAVYQALLKKYSVTIELPDEEPAPPDTKNAGAHP